MVIQYLKKPFFLSVIICVFVFYSGLFKIPQRNKIKTLIPLESITFVKGTVLSSPVKTGNGKLYSTTFSLEQTENQLYKSSASGNITIYIPSELVEAYFPGKLYSSATKKGAFLYESGGEYIFTGKNTKKGFYVEKCISSTWKEDFFGKIDFFRALCRLQFKRLMYSWSAAGGLLLALLSGAREYTESATSSNFKNSGLSHILALSGMHLSMFSSIAIFFGDRIGRKKLTYIIRIIVLIIFVWFAGFSPSLLRAFICAVLSLLCTMTGNDKPDMILILCFSFLLQVIISPSDIQNLGFMLSYGALLGILISGQFLNKIYSKIFPKILSSSFSASTGAQLFTAPISLKYFGTFCPIGIIATTVVSPLITVFIYSGLLLIILSLIFPSLQKPSGIFINFEYTIIKFLVSIFSKAPKWSIN